MKAFWRATFAMALLLVTAVPATAAEAEPRISRPGEYSGYAPVLYDEWVRTSQYVPMRDGTRLAVDL